MNRLEDVTKKPSRFFGPWIVMIVIPWLFPVILIALVITSAIKGSFEPYRKLHYWFFFSLIGLAVYAGFDYWLGVQFQEGLRSYGS
jgi:hypothetical protein